MRSRAPLLAAAVVASGCGGGPDEFAGQCIEIWNKADSATRDWVAKSGRDANFGPKADADFRAPVWFGPSKRDPEKCLAVVGLGGEDLTVMLRGDSPDSWVAVPGTSDEGTPEENRERVSDPVALGNEDGTVEPK
jgi:hypothetical protein